MPRTILKLDAVAAAISTSVAVVSGVVSGKLAVLAVGAAMVSCLLFGIRLLLEAMVERLANDCYDCGKSAERQALIRDLKDYVSKG